MIVGEQPSWNPEAWPAMVGQHRSLREQLRRARAKGVGVRQLQLTEIVDVAHPTRRALDHLTQRWLATRQLAPMAFVVQMEPFSFAQERRYFIAECADRIVGFLALVPIYSRNGWLLDDLLRDPQAPNGTAESLINVAMNTLAAEGCSYATLGLAPLAGAVHVPLRAVRRASRALFNFSGLFAFKSKLRPARWDPIYVAYEGSGALALFDVLSAFANGPLWRFGWATLMRGPAVVVRLLALLLVPWTALLALAPTTYFPSRSVQTAWVTFDIALAAALLSLTRRHRQWLAMLLSIVVTGDAGATLCEVLVFNAPHFAGAPESIACGAAIFGPSISALLLWRARLHRAAAASGTTKE